MNTEELRIITLERLNQLLAFEEAFNNNKYVSKLRHNIKQIQTIEPNDALKEVRDENERLTHLISRYSDENKDLEKELKEANKKIDERNRRIDYYLKSHEYNFEKLKNRPLWKRIINK